MIIPKRQRGLTLLELLVAIAVFTVVASLGYQGLQQTMTAKQQITRNSEQFAALQRSMLWLESDLTSLIARPNRDYLGDYQPAIHSRGQATAMRIEFTHGGRANPAGLPQSDLERVSYHWTAQGVIRQYWPRLDAIASSRPKEILLFVNTSEFNWLFLDQQNRWHNQWPPLNYTGDTTQLLPRAIRIGLTLPSYGRIERTFVTGAGA